MTDMELLLLCWMAYIDLPPLYVSVLERGGSVPVSVFADYVLRADAAGRLECVKLNDAAREAAQELRDVDWQITGYINDNSRTGFVAYIVDAGDTTVAAMRGSEQTGECVASNIDWVDNVLEPFAGSVQLAPITELAGELEEGNVIFTGHSKGGHNALLALAVSPNTQARAVAFNGQGFGEDALDLTQQQALRERGVNYVIGDDIVGALLDHPEQRIYARQRPGANAHMPEAYIFDASGNVVRGRRSLRSYAIEALTSLAARKVAASGNIGRVGSILQGLTMDAAANE